MVLDLKLVCQICNAKTGVLRCSLECKEQLVLARLQPRVVDISLTETDIAANAMSKRRKGAIIVGHKRFFHWLGIILPELSHAVGSKVSQRVNLPF